MLTENREQKCGQKLSNKHDSMQKESWKRETVTYLSLTTAEVAWPSNKSHRIIKTQTSPVLVSRPIFFSFSPPLSAELLFWPLISSQMFSHTLIFHPEVMGGNQCIHVHQESALPLVSCWLFWHQTCVWPTQQIIKRGLSSVWGWKTVMFVCSDGAAVNDDADRLSHMISLREFLPYFWHLSPHIRTIAVSHGVLMTTDTIQSTLSFIASPSALTTLLCHHCTDTHTQMHYHTRRKLTSYTETSAGLLFWDLHGHEHSQ